MEINRLVWYAVNIAKLAVHGIDRTEVMDVIETDAWVPDRHPAYPNQVRVIGPTRHGRLLTVVLEETDDPTSWRPVTGWPADRDEETYYYEATQ